MKVLLLSDDYPPDGAGGAGRIAHIQARALLRLGHSVSVLSTRQDASLPAEVTLEGVAVHRLLIRYPLRWRAYLSLFHPAVARQVGQHIEAAAPDVVHAHNIHTYLTYHSLALAHRRGIPTVLTTHDAMPVAYQKFDDFIDPAWQALPPAVDYRVRPLSEIARQRLRYFPMRNILIRRMLHTCLDALISPSRALLHVFRANRLSPPRMLAIANGIDPAAYASTPEEQAVFRQRHGWSGRQVAIFAGRVSHEKGARQLLYAMQQVVQRLPGALLAILARPGPDGEKIVKLAESLGIGQYIQFVGWLAGRDLSLAYGAAHVCVTPSIYFDNFPTVNLEAQAAGTPVVATCFGGSPEAVVDGQTGFVVNPYQTDALAGALVAILGDDDRCRAMGRAARRHALEHFHWLRQTLQIVALYKEIAQQNRTASSTFPAL